MNKHLKKLISVGILAITITYSCTNDPEPYVMNYDGKPFLDTVQATKIQTIPGKVQCEFYDLGGDSIAYHDSDRKNNGSGSLNTGGGYLNTFRILEAPDISFTKYHDEIDNSPYNMVLPEINQLYLGWTEPGEWTRYSVDVMKSASYSIGTMYTSNRGGEIQITIDDTDSTDFINIPTTFNSSDPVAWRQWHHWNYIDSLTSLYINKGRRIITLKIVKNGNFNFDYLKFEENR
jgi:hypothetical protein